MDSPHVLEHKEILGIKMEGRLANYPDPEPDSLCYLFELPGELRNEIYKLALYHPGGVTIDCVTQKLLTPQPLALAMTCKQIRNECENLLFAQDDLRLKSFSPISDIIAGNQFVLSLLVNSKLGSKFRGVHLQTETHGISNRKPWTRNYPIFCCMFERGVVLLCREHKFPIRWLFEVIFDGLLVAYDIDIKGTKSALTSLDESFKQANIPKESKLRTVHEVLKKVVAEPLRSIRKTSTGVIDVWEGRSATGTSV